MVEAKSFPFGGPGDRDAETLFAQDRMLVETSEAVVVIPTGMDVKSSTWIRKESDVAAGMAKPILAVHPLGRERNSTVVTAVATKTAGWNRRSVIKGACGLNRDFRGWHQARSRAASLRFRTAASPTGRQSGRRRTAR